MIQVLERGFKILEWIAENPDTPRTIGEMAEIIEVKSPTCYHIVNTLTELGYLEQLGPRKGYRLGPAVSNFAHISSYRRNLVDVARPLLREYSAEFGETALVAVVRGPRRYIICQQDGTSPLEVCEGTIIYDDIYETATGRLLLSYYSEKELQAFVGQTGMPKAGPLKGCNSIEEIKEALAEMRTGENLFCHRGGFSVALAFPIIEKGKVIAALGSFIPKSQFEGERAELIIKRLTDITETVNQAISKR